MDLNAIKLNNCCFASGKPPTLGSVFLQGLEENLRESQATAQRLETHLKQKEKLYEDKIKVRSDPESPEKASWFFKNRPSVLAVAAEAPVAAWRLRAASSA